jgi:sugar lactone lactonase YvrE
VIELSCVCDAKAVLGEGPYWDVVGQRLFWVDIKQSLIHQFDPDTGTDKQWSTPEVVGSLAVRQKGGLIVALRSGFYFYDLDLHEATRVAIPTDNPSGNRFNDGKTDRQGRFWAGSMDDNEEEPTGGLFRLDTNLNCKQLVDGVTVSNSLCWSPDGRIMYFGDSPRRTVWAWDFEPETGTVRNRRVLIQFAGDEGVPDGATVDAEGCIWLAHWDGWRVTRYDPKGRVCQVVRFPVQRPTCPMFGGPGLNLIYVTSASINLSNRDLREQPQAGGLFVFEAEVPGLPETPFQG